ncbi:MAG: hypothetical protein B6247_27695 [Candidatus Parabeggiatoa sp. nov. 2]|nr:MAG: hypothetical protein B6247_27695 [Beggiatoa sp. 4572_84]
MPYENKYIEVKVWSAKFTAYDAKKLIEQGVSSLLCHGRITGKAQKILNEADIQYRENISSDELEIDELYHDEKGESMEFLFMKGWDYGNSIVIRSQLLKDIVKTRSLLGLKNITETIPEGLEEAGEEIDRFDLREIRYQLAEDIATLLTGQLKYVTQQNGHHDNPQILVTLLQEILSEENTHFRFG